ncbi:MAG: hypothetical protein IJB51_04935, partial [Clostridia bacterium]|nr:hypothetical protein [Clostridia bacterium]
MSIHHERDPQKLVAYYDSLTIKPYDPVFVGEKRPGETLPPIESILTLNKDVEPFVIQASAQRTEFLGNDYDVLEFVHLSDNHAVLETWKLTPEGLILLSSEPAWSNGAPRWPKTPEETAR